MTGDAVPGSGSSTVREVRELPARILAGVPKNPAAPRYGGVVCFDGSVWAVETTRATLTSTGVAASINVPAHASEYIVDCHEDTQGRLVVVCGVHEWTRGLRPKVRRGARSRDDSPTVLQWQTIDLPPEVTPVSALDLEDRLVIGFASVEASPGQHVGGGVGAVSDRGDITWLYHAEDSSRQFVPIGLALLAGTIVFVDQPQHTLCRVESASSVSVLFGRPGRPGKGGDGLCSPSDVIADDKGVWIADSRNHRVVRLDRSGTFQREVGSPTVFDPRRLLAWDHGLFIADVSRDELVLYDGEKRSDVAGGADRAKLSYPRGVTVARNNVIVSDTCNDRVLSVTFDGAVISPPQVLSGPTVEPSWPRSAAVSPTGALAVCEGLRRRLVIHEGDLEWVVDSLTSPDGHDRLADPHDVLWLVDDEFVITDGSGIVARARLDGSAAWVTKLWDPHTAAQAWNGRLFVTDPEAGSVFELDPRSGDVLDRLDRFSTDDGSVWKLHRPRACCFVDDLLAVADDSGTVVAMGRDLVVRWRWDGSYRVGADRFQLRAPRALAQLHGELAATDYRNHLCVAVPFDAGPGDDPARKSPS